MLYVGLDAHLRTSSYHILDDRGGAVKANTVRGHWSKTVDELATLDEPWCVCFEASCGYGTLHDRLAQVADRVVVAHPGQLRLIFRSKRKSDRIDAAKLAKLLFLDEVPAVHVPTLDGRAWRELIEFRRRTVDKRTRTKNGLRALLRGYGVVKPREVGGLWTQRGRAWLGELAWPTPTASLRATLLLDELAHLEKQVRQITAELDRIGRAHPGVSLLQTIGGVGPRTAEAIAAYIDRPHRFARSKQIGAYFGLVPCLDASADATRRGHITREGPATARKLLIEATWQGIRRDAHLRQYFDRIVAGKPERRKIALIATAHHLLRCMLAMLKTGETWCPRVQSHAARAA